MPRPPFRRFRRSTPTGGHLPVLLDEVLDALQPGPGQTHVDATLGRAGHAEAILQRVGPDGLVVGFDLDPLAVSSADERLKAVGHPYSVHKGNFAGLASTLGDAGVFEVHGILADLGFSSAQVDDAERGLSYMRDGPLDMRLDPTRGSTAAQLLAKLSADDLATAFRDLGDLDDIAPGAASRLADAIVDERDRQPLERTRALADLVRQTIPLTPPPGPRLKGQPTARQLQLRPVAATFQALRILVNRELANLGQLLRSAPYLLAPGGRLAIISFHSGEDRLVKTAFRDGVREGVYAKISEGPVRATFAERGNNPRSRSAKLRWAEKA